MRYLQVNVHVNVYKSNQKCLSIESNNAIMGSLEICFFFIFCFVDYFVIVISLKPHSKVKGI